jgi:hypothetical protein
MNNYDSSYSYSPNNFIDHRKKIKFNPICIDSFFKNPNFIRDWALKIALKAIINLLFDIEHVYKFKK